MKEENVESLLDTLFELNRDNPEILKKVMNKKSIVKDLRFKELYDKLVDMHENPEKYNGVKAKTKGKLLEEIISILTKDTQLFDLYENITNDTNEYDIIITPSEIAKYTYNIYPDVMMQPIICECKNYKSKIDVTWIGKLYMLLSMSEIKLGIIFSYEPITGEEWGDAKGLIKKIFLKERIAIINFYKDDLYKIYCEEASFHQILEEKYNDLNFLSDLSPYKRNHISSDKVREILDKIKDEVDFFTSKKYKATKCNA